MTNSELKAIEDEAEEKQAMAYTKQQSSASLNTDNKESASSSSQDISNEQEKMADLTNSKSEAESQRAEEAGNNDENTASSNQASLSYSASVSASASMSASSSASISASMSASNSASMSAHIKAVNRNDTVQKKRQPASSKAASTAAKQTNTIVKADEAVHNYNDVHDYNPQADIYKGYHMLCKFTKEFETDAIQHQLGQSENAERLMSLLYQFAKCWQNALNKLWSSKNYDIYELQVQMQALKDAGSGMKGVDVKGQLGIILQWVRTGVPAKIDEDFQRIDKIANDPQFIAWAKQSHQNDELTIPKPMETTYDKVAQIKKRREQAENKQANQKKDNK